MSSSVNVKNISAQTSEKEVRDFFSFCGKISSLDLKTEGSTQSATVKFEKETAAKTALLLDNTQLGSSQVQVTADSTAASTGAAATSTSTTEEHDEISQEDKPRARVIAEYLAHGYTISDKAIEHALALDKQHGVSTRFTSTLQSIDQKYKATATAQNLDQKYQVSAKGNAAWQGLNSYFEAALGTPTGQKLRTFYEQGEKQVLDVHNEARHLANLKAGKATDMHKLPGSERTECSCASNSGKCPCSPGTCACKGCGKNLDEKTEGMATDMHKLPGSEKTECSCASDSGKCPCSPGTCACKGCGKNLDEKTTST